MSEGADLRTTRAVRERARAMLALAERDELDHFRLDLTHLPAVVDRVLAVTRASYPDLGAIPPHARWRHFGAGGVDRLAELDRRLQPLDRAEALRARIDLVVVSVLLDAGAGPRWSFREPGTGQVFTRSEGLAVASFHAFLTGAFSSDPARPLRVDAAGLGALDEEALGRAFQADGGSDGDGSTLVGLAGRAALMRRLGEVVGASPFFTGAIARVGNLADFLLARAESGVLPAVQVFAAVLAALAPIWPSPRGDVWPHPRLGLVPFHKLSQWLTYSLLEPLAAAGVTVVEQGELTGLAEYRNGGLFLDGGVLAAKDDRIFNRAHAVGAPPVVEWRALTVALLDRVADELRVRLGMSAESLPLARVLEGGTWQAGRVLAREKRPDGRSPLEVDSDGTVF